MDVKYAKQLLLHATCDGDGIFTRLRGGEDPGDDRIRNLRKALRQLFREHVEESVVPRDVAFSCGIIMHFANECRTNLKTCSTRSQMEDAVGDLEQGAFDVLAGGSALGWIVSRPDLDE